MPKQIKSALIAAVVVFITIKTLGMAGVKLGPLFAAGSTGASLSVAMQYAIVAGVSTLVAGTIAMLTTKGIEASRANFGQKLTGRGAQVPRQIIYGKCRVGGVIVRMTTTGTENNTLHIAAVIAGHEINSLTAVYINDELLTTTTSTVNGETVYTATNANFTNTQNDNAFSGGRLIRYTFHDGSQTAVDGFANATLPNQYPSTATFRGMAYIYMQLIYDPEKNNQMPALWFEVEGKKLYDPRTGSTAYSNNPALVVRDYLTDTVYGLGCTASEINDGASGTAASFYEAAQTCDDDLNIPDTTELTTYAVSVVNSGGNKYFLTPPTSLTPTLTLKEGNTYRFDQSASSNSGHPLRFSTTSDGTHGGGSEYTTNVTTVGTAGSSGAYTQITVAVGAPTLYYYCTNHSGMGGQINTSAAATEKRYTTNGFTNASASGDGVLEAVLSSCAGSLTYTNGKFNMFVGGDQTPSLTITDEDILGTVQISTRAGSGELYNVVKSIYVDSSKKYEGMEAPVYEDATFLAADTPTGEQSANYKRILELQLPFTSTVTTAQRLQEIVLKRQRQTTTVSLLTTLEYLKLQPNDWVRLTNSRMGYTNKTFEVLSTNMEFLETEGEIFTATRLTLQEIDTTVYDYGVANYQTTAADGENPDGGSMAIGAPSGLTLTQLSEQEGPNAKISVRLDWTNNASDAVQGTEIQYRLSTQSDSDYRTIQSAGKGISKAVFTGGVVGDIYYVRIRHFSFDNVISDWATMVQITIAEPDTIGAPTGVTATGGFNAITFTFTTPQIESTTQVNIYYSTNSGFTPSSSNLLTTVGVGANQTRKHTVGTAAGLAYDTVYYFKLSCQNVYGTESSFAGQVNATMRKAQSGDIEDGEITTAKFASTIEPVSLVSSVPSSKTTETIYNTANNKLYRWNGSSYVVVEGASSFSELSGTITTTQITDDAITSPKIAANAVTASEILAGTITSNELASNSVIAGKIAAGAVSASQISVSELSAIVADLGTITAGVINTAGGSTKLSLGSDGQANSAIYLQRTSTSSGDGVMMFLDDTTSNSGYYRVYYNADQGDTMKVRGVGTGSYVLHVDSEVTTSGIFAIFDVRGYSSVGGQFTQRKNSGSGTSRNPAIRAQHIASGTTSAKVDLATADGYASYIHSGTNGPFTAAHDSLILKTEAFEEGDIVVDTTVANKRGISDVICYGTKSTEANQKGAIGVYNSRKSLTVDQPPAGLTDHYVEVDNPNDPDAPLTEKPVPIAETETISDTHDVAMVNSIGEGLINVCGEAGNIALGDLIVPSGTAGKGMKQSDDIIRSQTVAKAREAVTFASASDTAQIACTYVCG